MSNMFNSMSKPFYQSAVCMGLDPIPMQRYADFAVRLFEDRSKHIRREVIEKSYQLFDGCTWFVQLMMNELFALTESDGLCDMSMLDVAEGNVVLSQESSYKDLLSHLAPKQKLVLQAIAKEGIARNVTSSAFIKKYNLPSTSSVQSAVKGLLKNDVITQEDDTYRVYDYFFSIWLARDY